MKVVYNYNMLQKHKTLFYFIVEQKNEAVKKMIVTIVHATIHPAFEFQDLKGRTKSSSRSGQKKTM